MFIQRYTGRGGHKLPFLPYGLSLAVNHGNSKAGTGNRFASVSAQFSSSHQQRFALKRFVTIFFPLSPFSSLFLILTQIFVARWLMIYPLSPYTSFSLKCLPKVDVHQS